MHVLNAHSRAIDAPRAAVFHEIRALGTDADRIWPSARMPFVRTPGAPCVGSTTERHGIIRATLDRYEPDSALVWRSNLSYIVGTHGFFVEATSPTTCVVEHVLDARLGWWFVPAWQLKVAAVHDLIIERLFDRLAAAVTSPWPWPRPPEAMPFSPA